MTATLDAARVAELGFCATCYALGQAVPVEAGRDRCRSHLVDECLVVESTRSGQFRVGVPAQARRRRSYATGQQAACVRCAAAGVDRRGVSRDGAKSDPLCLPCWRGPRDRQEAAERRRLVAGLRERLGDVVDELVEPAGLVEAGCAACGAVVPVPDCWLCGYSWLAQARAEFEAEQAEEAARVAAEAALLEARFTAIAECTAAERRVEELTAWVGRLRAVLDGYSTGDSRSRAVELFADALMRDAAARSTRRGRPPVEMRRVWAVLAVDADWRSGRRGMPGRARSAELAGTVTRVVTDGWARAEVIGWAERTAQGRRLSFAERVELGRAQDRAEFDLAPLHKGDVTGRSAHVPVALAILADLLEHAVTLLEAAQTDLDVARGRAGDWTERPEVVRRLRMRQAVAASVTQIRNRVSAAQPTQDIDGNFLSPHMVFSRMRVYSCFVVRGLAFSAQNALLVGGVRRTRRREGGASRSSTRAGLGSGCAGSPRSGRPRPLQRACGSPSRPRRRPQWAGWAYPLAKALQGVWRWTAELPLPRVAAILGTRLGPRWTAEALNEWVRQARGRAVLVDPRDPGAYLCAVLDEALTSGQEPPHWSRRVERAEQELAELRRALVVEQAAAQRQRLADLRAEAAGREAVAVSAGGNAAYQAARAALARRTAPAAEVEDWPPVPQPGSGLPVDRR